MKKNILKNVSIGLLSVFLTFKILLPATYSLFINLLGISINLLSTVIIGSSILGIIVSLGLIKKCIEVKEEYEYSYDIESEQDCDLMRQQLKIVESKNQVNNKENKSSNKYTYLYDHNYTDVEDIEIDDIMNPNWRDEFNPQYSEYIDDRDVKIYSRKK